MVLDKAEISGLSDELGILMDVGKAFGDVGKAKVKAEKLTKMEVCFRDGGCDRKKSLMAEGKFPQAKRLCFRCMDVFYSKMHI